MAFAFEPPYSPGASPWVTAFLRILLTLSIWNVWTWRGDRPLDPNAPSIFLQGGAMGALFLCAFGLMIWTFTSYWQASSKRYTGGAIILLGNPGWVHTWRWWPWIGRPRSLRQFHAISEFIFTARLRGRVTFRQYSLQLIDQSGQRLTVARTCDPDRHWKQTTILALMTGLPVAQGISVRPTIETKDYFEGCAARGLRAALLVLAALALWVVVRVLLPIEPFAAPWQTLVSLPTLLDLRDLLFVGSFTVLAPLLLRGAPDLFVGNCPPSCLGLPPSNGARGHRDDLLLASAVCALPFIIWGTAPSLVELHGPPTPTVVAPTRRSEARGALVPPQVTSGRRPIVGTTGDAGSGGGQPAVTPPTQPPLLVARSSTGANGLQEWQCAGGTHSFSNLRLRGWTLIMTGDCELTCLDCSLTSTDVPAVQVSGRGRFTMVGGRIEVYDTPSVRRTERGTTVERLRGASGILVSGQGAATLTGTTVNGDVAITIEGRARVALRNCLLHGLTVQQERGRLRDDGGNFGLVVDSR